MTENGTSIETKKPIENIKSVNWHIWERCNYKCKFCFATFSQVKERLPKEQALMMPILLADSGVEKLNFVGGEPLLCPYIGDLLSVSKKVGLVTSIVTNATRLTRKFLEDNARNIDWIGISIDSSDENTEKSLGRGAGNHVKSANACLILNSPTFSLRPSKAFAIKDTEASLASGYVMRYVFVSE